MRGYTVKKGNRYYAVIFEGIDPQTGKERRRWHPAGTSKREAEKLVTDLVKRVNDGRYKPPDRTTLALQSEKWLAGQKARLRPSTFDSYRRLVAIHIAPYIGAIPVQKLKAEDLDGLYAKLLEAGRADGHGGLSVKTVRNVHVVIRKMLADAARKGSVVRNVAVDADPPKLSAGRRAEIKVWTSAELHRCLEGPIGDHRLFSAFHLAAHTGMRRGEVLGLRWSDIDLSISRLSVRPAVISVAYEIQLSDIKTEHGRRTIDIDAGTVALLKKWRVRQQREHFALLGRRIPENALVFSSPTGEPIHPDLFSQIFDRAVARSGLPRIRLHDLRHTHASILLANGVPVKVVSERLGHATPAFTMSVYQTVLPGMGAKAAAIFANLIAHSDEADDQIELEKD